jgi:hypothetical protein
MFEHRKQRLLPFSLFLAAHGDLPRDLSGGMVAF